MNILTLENPSQQQVVLENIINSVVLAFSADPIARWMYPSPQEYLSNFPNFIKSFGGKAFDSQTVYYADLYSGAAFWFPPQIEPDTDAVVDVIHKTISTENVAQVLSLLEQTSYFHPSEPHWYLAILGVELNQQKKGYGSALMQQILNHCDRHNQLAYLESSNIANLAFYEKHGFEVIGVIQTGNSPSMFPMVRYPQNIKD
ncbi:GNAT family N-acetyltransferase [Pleurocapsales cyanobacterium LEGE 10410]|nr:GNAT family N-acetyltransferase [Pleurocapsales cyanobacterium LEGE 10410]